MKYLLRLLFFSSIFIGVFYSKNVFAVDYTLGSSVPGMLISNQTQKGIATAITWHYPSGYWGVGANLDTEYGRGWPVPDSQMQMNGFQIGGMKISYPIPSDVQQKIALVGTSHVHPKITVPSSLGDTVYGNIISYKISGNTITITFTGVLCTSGNYWAGKSGFFYLPKPENPAHGCNYFSVFKWSDKTHLGSVKTGSGADEVNSPSEIIMAANGKDGYFANESKYYYVDEYDHTYPGGSMQIGVGTFADGGAQGVGFNFEFDIDWYVEDAPPVHVDDGLTGYQYKDAQGSYWIQPSHPVTFWNKGNRAYDKDNNPYSDIMIQYARVYNSSGIDTRAYHEWNTPVSTDATSNNVNVYNDTGGGISITSASEVSSDSTGKKVSWGIISSQNNTDTWMQSYYKTTTDLYGPVSGWVNGEYLRTDGDPPDGDVTVTDEGDYFTVTATNVKDSRSGVKVLKVAAYTDTMTSSNCVWTTMTQDDVQPTTWTADVPKSSMTDDGDINYKVWAWDNVTNKAVLKTGIIHTSANKTINVKYVLYAENKEVYQMTVLDSESYTGIAVTGTPFKKPITPQTMTGYTGVETIITRDWYAKTDTKYIQSIYDTVRNVTVSILVDEGSSKTVYYVLSKDTVKKINVKYVVDNGSADPTTMKVISSNLYSGIATIDTPYTKYISPKDMAGYDGIKTVVTEDWLSKTDPDYIENTFEDLESLTVFLTVDDGNSKTVYYIYKQQEGKPKTVNVKYVTEDGSVLNQTEIPGVATQSVPFSTVVTPDNYDGYTIQSIVVYKDWLPEGSNIESSYSTPQAVTISIAYDEGDSKTIVFTLAKTDVQPSGTGEIIFNPDSTEWTNQGKISEGVGSYPVNVSYSGTNPMILKGTVTIIHDDPNTAAYTYTKTFDVTYKLKSITVSGAADAVIDGANGVVNITQQGINLSLSGTGTWDAAQYTLPTIGQYETIKSKVIPPAPDQPTGESEKYNLDWSKTDINLPAAQSTWINTPIPYIVPLTVTDNLSGFDANSKVTIDDKSHYDNETSISLPKGQLYYSKDLELKDGMYKITVNADDIATNQNSQSSETYLIDGTKPTVTFSVPSGIFSDTNGAIRKQSSQGTNFAYYGTITGSDNLSGVAKIDYGWTFGSSDPSSYTTIYQSDYTYTDRHSENISREVEKPVGDNLYLSVRLWDTAGNVTYQKFGPFEDPIKLKNFEVTDVRDPLYDSVFWTDDTFTTPTGVTYKASKLPIDGDSHPTIKNAYPKKGYAFYFDITSEYLYRDNDRIEIVPTFYYQDGTNRIPCDGYYDLNNNPLTKIGGSADTVPITLDTSNGKAAIGGFSKLTLTKNVRVDNGLPFANWKNQIQYTNGKEQWWYGKYFIPATSVFVKQGDTPRPENILKDGHIIINFQIIAYKNGIETLSTDQNFVYTPNQWTAEGGPKNVSYQPGDTAVFDNKYSALSNYQSNIIQ